jgi:hypothetical protein
MTPDPIRPAVDLVLGRPFWGRTARTNLSLARLAFLCRIRNPGTHPDLPAEAPSAPVGASYTILGLIGSPLAAFFVLGCIVGEVARVSLANALAGQAGLEPRFAIL